MPEHGSDQPRANKQPCFSAPEQHDGRKSLRRMSNTKPARFTTVAVQGRRHSETARFAGRNVALKCAHMCFSIDSADDEDFCLLSHP
jgi:hypothetical protein